MHSPRRVLFVRANSLISDPRVEKEAATLIDAGYQVEALGWDRSATYPLRRVGDINAFGRSIPRMLIGSKGVFGAGVKNLRPMLFFERQLVSYLCRNAAGYDYVHACDMDTGYAAMLGLRGTDTKLLYDIFDCFSESRSLPASLKKLARRMEKRVIEAADAVIICTDDRRQQIDHANPKNITVIENIPYADLLEGAFGSAAETEKMPYIVLSYTGSFGGDRYVKELLSVVASDKSLYLKIAGSGALIREVEEAAAFCERIRYYGKVSHLEALEIESSSDVVVACYDPSVPNNVLAAPNKYYEALMLGIPIISTDGTSVGSWVRHFDVGESLPVGFSLEQFGFAIHAVAEKNANGEISRRARGIYESRYKWDEMGRRLTALYSSLGEGIS